MKYVVKYYYYAPMEALMNWSSLGEADQARIELTYDGRGFLVERIGLLLTVVSGMADAGGSVEKFV